VSRLTPTDYDKVVKALTHIGYVVCHQRGSHIVLRLVDDQRYVSLFGCRKKDSMVVVPAHKPIGKGMLRTIIREAALSVDEFNKLL
jgi:predicted RNA binding protein YcfA (HicA-like mRNA interferase family)